MMLVATLMLAPAAGAEPIRAPEDPKATAPGGLLPDTATVADTVSDEVAAQGLLDATDRSRTEVASQPFQPRAANWIQNGTESQNADERRREDAATRDRATVAWLLDDEARRQQDSATPGAAAASSAAEDDESVTGWRRAIAIPILLALMVSAGLAWLVRRPGDKAATATRSQEDSPSGGKRRRRRSRRHGTAGDTNGEHERPAAASSPGVSTSG